MECWVVQDLPFSRSVLSVFQPQLAAVESSAAAHEAVAGTARSPVTREDSSHNKQNIVF